MAEKFINNILQELSCGFAVVSVCPTLPVKETVHELKDLTDVLLCMCWRVPSFFLHRSISLSSKVNLEGQTQIKFFQFFFKFCTIANFPIPYL